MGHFLPKVKCIKCPKQLIDKNILSLTEDKAVLLGSKPFNGEEILQFALINHASFFMSLMTITILAPTPVDDNSQFILSAC